jgi:hypothetical protein
MNHFACTNDVEMESRMGEYIMFHEAEATQLVDWRLSNTAMKG